MGKLYFILFLLFSNILFASDFENIINSIHKDLKEIKKIATKEKSNKHYQPYIISVLKNKDLTKLGISTLKEALLLLPNIDISSDNVAYKSIIFRGSNPVSFGQSKLFIDDVLVNNIYFDGYSEYLDMPIELIKRIEVIRGPDNDKTLISGYAGSIHVFTYAENIKENTKDYGFLKYGSNNYKSIGFRKSFDINDIKIFTDFFYKRHDNSVYVNSDALASGIFDYPYFGITNSHLSKATDVSLYLKSYSLGVTINYQDIYLKSRIYSYKQSTAFGLNYIPSPEENYLKMPNYYLQLGYKTNYKDLNIELKTGINYNSSETKSKLAPDNVTLPKMSNPYEKVTFTDGIYGENIARQQSIFHSGFFKYSAIKNHNIEFDYRLSHTKTTDVVSKITNRDTGIGLVDYSDILPFFDKDAKRNSVIFTIKDKYKFNEKLQFLSSLTYENNTHIDPVINPKVSLVYNLKDNNIVKLLYSKAHRTPSWQELYTINNLSRLGNKELKPEKIQTFELSHIKHFSNDSFLQTTLFYIQNKDQIHNYTPNNQYINSDSTNYLHGIELEYKGHLSAKDNIYLNFSYTDGTNSQRDALALVSKILAKGYYTYNIKENLSLSAILKYSSKKDRVYEDKRDPIPASTIVDASLNYKSFRSNTNINFSIKNIFDQEVIYPSKPRTYQNDYPDVGRVFNLSISKEF